MPEFRRGRSDRLATPPSAADTVARVFFALWPDGPTRGVLAKLAESVQYECGGRTMLARNIHLTLVFIGNVAVSRVPELRALVHGIASPPFELIIDTIEFWRHNRIVWAGPSECPAALRLLVESLEDALRKAGFHIDERQYAPHITLLRDARRAPAMQITPEVHWHVNEFALVQSSHRDKTPAYEPIQLWPLGTAA